MIKGWHNETYKNVLGKKTVIASHGGVCIQLSVDDDNQWLVQHPPQYQGSHTEADTLIAFHARQEEGDFVVRSSDTDVLVILIGMIGAHLED